MKTAKLTKKNLATLKKNLHADWEISDDSTELFRTYTFRSFIEGFMFVTRISVHAEVMRHHPEVYLTESYVTVTLATKDSPTVTEIDFELAQRFDNLYSLSTEKKVLRRSR